MNKLKSFLWFCSGASTALLKRAPTDSEKYAGIGGTILFTGILASISSGYALYTVFNNYYISIGFGLLWGLMIFNLDRYIVSSMRKRGHVGKELGMAAPRLILAIVLALVISKPLELKIFEKEINRKLDEKKLAEVDKSKSDISKLYEPDLLETQARLNAYKAEVKDKAAYRDTLQKEYDYERFGAKTAGTSGIVGLGSNARKKEQQLDAAESDLKRVTEMNQPKIDTCEARVKALEKAKEDNLASLQYNIANYEGFAARIEALSDLGEESKPIRWANWFITLLFICIEIAPVLVKLITTKGPYDNLLEMRESFVESFKIEQVSLANQRTNERLQIAIETSNNKTVTETESNKEMMRRVVDAEMEVAQETIDQWKRDEIAKLNRK